MNPLPKPALQVALVELSARDEFKVVLQFIREEREQFIRDLRQAEGPNDVMKLSGSISTLDELLMALTLE